MKTKVYREVDHCEFEGEQVENVEHRCSHCKSHLYMNQRFCDGCGDELDWSEIDVPEKIVHHRPSESYKKHKKTIENFMSDKHIVTYDEICEAIYQITGIEKKSKE